MAMCMLGYESDATRHVTTRSGTLRQVEFEH